MKTSLRPAGFRLLALLAWVVLATGCSTVLPKTGEIRAVHEAYRQDFADFAIPPAGEAAVSRTNAHAFARTLQAIRDYRVLRPEATNSLEGAHLQVLEGMVYLQSQRFGLAQLVADDVRAASERLATRNGGGGRITRDQVIGAAFPQLLAGWSEVVRTNSRRWDVILTAAEAIHAQLLSTNFTRRYDPEGDQGAVYVANCAAIFYVWAHRDWKVAKVGPDGVVPKEAELERRRERYGRAKELLGGFLSPEEKSAVGAAELGQGGAGRARYVQWYHWLGANGG